MKTSDPTPAPDSPSDPGILPEGWVTTGHKTHRYLRLSLVLLVVTLLLSVLIQTVVSEWEPLEVGWNLLPSISHYYFTPARNVFVGTLVAASVVLLALSGRGRATTLLDIAAIFAPLIALVPTGIPCGGSTVCVPAESMDDVRVGVATYVIVVIVVVVTMAVIRKAKGIANPGARLVSIVALVTGGGLAILAFVPGLNDEFPFNLWPIGSIHFAVTLLFFGAFAAVPILHARERSDPGEVAPTPRHATIYRWVTWLMMADLVVLIVAPFVHGVTGGFPLVLIGETIALGLFAWFWWVQTFQRWNERDQRYVAE